MEDSPSMGALRYISLKPLLVACGNASIYELLQYYLAVKNFLSFQ